MAETDATLFELFELINLIDASGAGCCRLGPDEHITAASPNFVALLGARAVDQIVGRRPSELIPELPSSLPAAITATPTIVRVVGADGIGRELAVAHNGGVLLVADRSSEAKLRRSEARLGRQIDDLQAELTAREREPRRPPIRTMTELATRLDEALMRARRYQHHVTIAAIRLGRAPVPGRIVGETIIGCVRGVDDLGRAADDHWILVLPHTDLAGGEIVGKRVLAKLGALELDGVGIGVAQVGLEEPGSAAVERADRVSVQALENGGGLLLAVALI